MPKTTNTLGNTAALLLASQLSDKQGAGGGGAMPGQAGGGASMPGATPQLMPGGVVVLNNQERRVFNKVLAGLGIALGAGIAFLVTRRIIRGFWFRKTVDEIDDKDNSAYFAQRLVNAMNPDSPFGWGTDEELVRDTIMDVPHQVMWRKVKDAYKRLEIGATGRLMDDLRGELSRQMFSEITAILDMLPANARDAKNRDPFAITDRMLNNWATRIKAGAEYEYWPFGGTDEAAIYKVLEEVPSLEAFELLNERYRRFNTPRYSVMQELQDEMSGTDLQLAYDILNEKDDATASKLQQLIAHG